VGKKKKDPEYEEDEPEIEDAQGLIPIEDERELVRYLDEQVVSSEPAVILTAPPDLTRCQCEWRDTSGEVTFGPKPLVRCDQEPTVIAFQKRNPDEDNPTGAISLCDEHRALVDHMYPHQCYFRQITSDKKIGDFA